MTPDTAALRALADICADARVLAPVDPTDLRALCDAADEVERLTSKYEEWESMHSACIALREDVARHEREAVVLNESIGRHRRDLDAAGESLRRVAADRDAARADLAALVADLRALHYTWVNPDDDDPYCGECGEEPPCKTVALLDRHAPETTTED